MYRLKFEFNDTSSDVDEEVTDDVKVKIQSKKTNLFEMV